VGLTREIQRGNRFLKGDNIGNIAWLLYEEVWKIKDAKRIGKKTPHLKSYSLKDMLLQQIKKGQKNQYFVPYM
jgi:hypothetical protein